MIPYEQLRAQVDQKLARYQADAAGYRVLQSGRQRSNWLRGRSWGRRGSRFGASRVGNPLFGGSQGPVQPAI
jgi:hypothetical protein